MGFLRSITDALVLSGYHGPRTAEIWQKLDLKSVLNRDLRPEIGRVLLGQEVHYPQQNPAPQQSKFRLSYRDPEKLRDALGRLGIRLGEGA
jgi:hypothetical protein